MASKIEKTFLLLCSAAIIATILLMNVEIFARFFLNTSTKISDEFSSYLFCAATMLGFYPALMRGRFLRIPVALSLLPLRFRAVWEAVIALFSALFCLLLAWETWELFQMSRHLGSVSEQYSATPLMYPQLVLPIGLVLLALAMGIRGFQLTRQLWRGETGLLKEENDVLE